MLRRKKLLTQDKLIKKGGGKNGPVMPWQPLQTTQLQKGANSFIIFMLCMSAHDVIKDKSECGFVNQC